MCSLLQPASSVNNLFPKNASNHPSPRLQLTILTRLPSLPQIVTGYGEAGNALVTSPDVGKIIFVGSTQIGRKVRPYG